MYYWLVVDVVVVGAGIVGAACALECAEAGLSVTVVDQGAIASGTTGAGEGNLLVSDKPPGPELELALLSNSLWREVADRLDRDIELEAKGGLVVAPDGTSLSRLRALAAAQATAGVTAVGVSADRLADHEPYLRAGLAGGTLYPQDMQLQPMLATAAVLSRARQLGATVLPHTTVTGIRCDSDGAVASVLTTAGELSTSRVVNAAGTRSSSVAAMAGSHVPVLPRRGFILVTAAAPVLVRHKVYNAGYVDDVASGDGRLQSSAVIEGTHSGTILIGATREIVGFDRELSFRALRRLAAQAVDLFPVLAHLPVLRSYSGFRPYTPDHLPVIGLDPAVPGLFHACGHEGAGIGLATGTARLVVDAMLGRASQVDPGPFSAGRFAAVAVVA
jgi:D-hydroxyproline dehydrogenase subunit beta